MDAPYVVSLGAVCDPPGTRARIVDESRCNVMPQPRRPARALPSAHSFATSIGTSCSLLVVARELAEQGDAQCTAVRTHHTTSGDTGQTCLRFQERDSRLYISCK